ncbi:NAD(P)H dependent flavin oxidoreductase family protein [Achromobacter xylosoxidans]|uniref:NAD(P)H dependent flavin oxidoreductase family protein n=1 Tax=Alcaligenes xylosoxydans xylosoxydans TaxID=85698 RepID=UPI0006C1845E|nr:NAD(P)H dependent flavin oxidoreductase family protein [Achromobacter xylosoxidans]CUI71639.1 CDP-6-deoxy-L-threo-D-glycero-4-hexulose-3-dehyd rase reductase [Achromobacter xylosoxidans]
MSTPAHAIILEHGRFTSDGSTSILEAALAQGVAVPFSCQRGECGSCRAQVAGGAYARIAPPTERTYVTAADELLMCQCRATGDLALRFAHWQAPAQPARHYPVTVLSRVPLTADVTQLIVAPHDAAGAFTWQAGQHVRFLMEDGGERPFSIASVPAAAGPARLEFHIRRMPGGGFTERVLPRLMPGDTLTLAGPHGACVWPAQGWAEAVQELVLLATGTGYAGVHAIMMAALQDPRIRRVTLYWGGRDEDDCYAGPLLNALQGKHSGFQWQAVLSRASATPAWHVQDAALAADHDWPRTVAYACGNPAMVRAARDRLCAAGLPPDRFVSEAFVPARDGPATRVAPAPAHPWEQVGQRFSLDGILDARRRSREAVREIAALLRPGMTTREAVTAADAHLRRMGASHNWHPTYVRFGPDSQSPAVQPTDFQRRLRDDDVFVVDIGPVWDGYEGDYGDTFVLGADADRRRCAEAARQVFRRTREDWLRGLTGAALYDRAEAYARDYGCELVREVPGHRVADFPHALYGRHRLAQAGFVPADGIWVLEIQVRDRTLPIGAFYEDVLLREMADAAA